MLIEKLKNLPPEKSLKEAQAGDAELSSLVESFLAELSAPYLESLAARENTAAADLLQRIDGGAFAKDLQKAARKALHRLSTKGIKPSETMVIKKESSSPPPVFKEAYASEVDGAGNQLLLGVLADNYGGLTLAYFLGDEASGFTSVTLTKAARKQLQEYISHYEDHHIHLTALGLEEFCWLIYRYQSITERLQKSLPLAFNQAQKLLGGSETWPKACPLYEKLSWPRPAAADYLARADKLVDASKISWWLPEDKVKIWQEKFKEAQSGVLVLSKMTKEEQLEEIQNQARQDLLAEEISGKIKARMEVWACLLWAQGKTEPAQGVLASAKALAEDPSGQKNPLLQAGIKLTLEGVTAALCDHEHGHGHEHVHKEENPPGTNLLWVPGAQTGKNSGR
jgi:hypothetical protein